jgi:hypothetical protein
VGFDQRRHRFAAEQGHVSGKEQQVAGGALELGLRLKQGVSGAELRFLGHEAAPGANRFRHGSSLVAHDHGNRGGPEGPACIEHVVDEGAPCQTMQHFGAFGPHARAFAGGENDDVKRAHRDRVY